MTKSKRGQHLAKLAQNRKQRENAKIHETEKNIEETPTTKSYEKKKFQEIPAQIIEEKTMSVLLSSESLIKTKSEICFQFFCN